MSAHLDVADLLAWSVAVSATAAGAVLAVRALPAVQKAMYARKKPWACDICMGFWMTGLVSVALASYKSNVELVFTAGPAYPFTLWLLRKLQEPMNPPSLPPLQE